MDRESNVKWNPFVPGYFENPYQHLKDCRERSAFQKIFPDSYMFFRHEDVAEILQEKDFIVHSLSTYLGEKEDYIFKDSAHTGCPFLSKATQMWPMYLNGDIHRRIRTAITKAFYSNPVDRILEESLALTLQNYKDHDYFNLKDFCGNYIYLFVKQIFMLNENEYRVVERFSNLLARSQDLYIPKQVYKEINDEILLQKNIFSKTSLFKNSLLEETNDLNLNEDQLYSIMLISFMASFETSKDSMSLGLSEVLKNPLLVSHTLNSNSSQIKLLVEEIFRFNSPLQYTIRKNTSSLYLYGELIPENSKLYLCIASANRDANVFENPDSFIADRDINPHLAFGGGVHQCLGAVIARKELNLCLQPMIEFLKDFTVEETKWSKQIFMRTINKAMVRKKRKHV